MPIGKILKFQPRPTVDIPTLPYMRSILERLRASGWHERSDDRPAHLGWIADEITLGGSYHNVAATVLRSLRSDIPPGTIEARTIPLIHAAEDGLALGLLALSGTTSFRTSPLAIHDGSAEKTLPKGWEERFNTGSESSLTTGEARLQREPHLVGFLNDEESGNDKPDDQRRFFHAGCGMILVYADVVLSDSSAASGES